MQPTNDSPIDDQFLAAMGLGNLPADQKQAALYDILFTLDKNVADQVADSLSEEQLNEFNALMDKKPSDQELSEWLRTNVPNYQQLIEEEAQKMKSQNSDTIKKVMES